MEKPKHAGGRPPMYKEASEMQAKIDAYIAKCEEGKTPLTIAGLSLACNFLTRHSLIEYEKKPEFMHTIKKARLHVEAEVERRLFSSNPTGSIFWLKNHAGYVDKQEQVHSGEVINRVV